MVKKFELKKDAGSLMVEALAMLALIAMVTPILYKKAAERTSELQDINAASQMRVMIKAVDDYLRDNYQDIINGRSVSNSCGAPAPVYTSFATSKDAYATVDIAHFCDYLPYGFVDKDGKVQGSYSFGNYQVSIKKRAASATADPTGKNSATLTGFIIADPKNKDAVSMLRSSRIASMIGANGGYTKGNVGNGVQGVWNIPDIKKELGLTPIADGSVMAASMQPVTDGSSVNENTLYRIGGVPKELNTMRTALEMGGNDINDVHKMIISGADLGSGDDALLIEKGGAKIAGVLDAAGGNFHVNANGDTSMGAATIGGNASIAGTANITGNTTIGGTANIAGNTTIGGTADIKGDTNIGGNLNVGDKDNPKDLHVFGNATIDKNLTVGGDTTLKGGLTVNGVTNLGGDLNITGITNATGIINANGGLNAAWISTPKIMAKTLRGGLLQDDFSAHPENDKYAFTAYWIGENNGKAGNVYAGRNDELIVGNRAVQLGVSGEFQVSDKKIVAGLNNEIEVLSGSGAAADVSGVVRIGPGKDARELIVSNGQTLVDNGKFLVQTGDKGVTQVETSDTRLDVMKDGAGSLFAVDDSSGATKGSVHVRKGVLEVASKYGVSGATGLDSGYVKADRFVDNKTWDNAANPLSGNGYDAAGVKRYDAYQVNPAYTSIMHDIKLTTRGGARLSDILPDFINKGIYVVDNTYNEDVPYWGSLSVSASGGKVVASGTSGKECTSHTCWTSPWLGLVPAPQCPPGYAKVVTITPAGWAMAQAGVPGTRVGNNRQDLLTPDMPKNPNDYASGAAGAPMPLYFQKSTWLRANVYPHGSGKDFYGWSAIMGFMYPYSYYKEYIDLVAPGMIQKEGSGNSNQWVVWNLFPVLRRQLEAYVTVYCYFDRTNNRYNSNYVDKYDQLNKFRKGWDTDATYRNRLDDESLGFKEPW